MDAYMAHLTDLIDDNNRSILSQTTSDPLAVLNSLIGLFADSMQACSDITRLNTSSPPQADVAPLEYTRRKLQSFQSTMHGLYSCLRHVEKGRSVCQDRRAQVRMEILIAALTESILTISNIGAALAAITSETWSFARSSDPGAELKCLADRLHNGELLLFMVLDVLQSEDEDEAQRHAAQLQSQGLELIQSNDVLLNGLQELRGTLYERYLLAEKWAISKAIIPSSHDDPDIPGQSQPPSHTSAMEHNRSTSKGPLDSRSRFSDLTLADFHIPSLIPLPIRSAEIKNGTFYTLAYCQFVHEKLDATSTEGATEIQITQVLTRILGL